MLNVHELNAQDLQKLCPGTLADVAAQMLQYIAQQSKQIDAQAQAIKFRDAKIERITFELRRLKAWRFAAKTERMNAEQRQLFEETLAADQASLERVMNFWVIFSKSPLCCGNEQKTISQRRE